MTSSKPGRLIIVCGLPGSGKTTLALALEDALGAVRLSPDDWMDALGVNLHDQRSRSRVEALQWTLGQRLLTLGSIVIIEWGTWARSERDVLRAGARAVGADVELHCTSAPADVLISRTRARAKENPPVSDADIRRWFDAFEPPTEEEFCLYDAPIVSIRS